MTHVTCRLTAKNRDRFRNPTLGNRVWATFIFFRQPNTDLIVAISCHVIAACCRYQWSISVRICHHFGARACARRPNEAALSRDANRILSASRRVRPSVRRPEHGGITQQRRASRAAANRSGEDDFRRCGRVATKCRTLPPPLPNITHSPSRKSLYNIYSFIHQNVHWQRT